jgi:hypothetical protein
MPTHTRRTDGANESVPNHAGGLYKIRIKGHLDAGWLDWFEGMTLRYVLDKQTGLEFTELRGVFADQPALHGILIKIRDLNLTLISVRKINCPEPERKKRTARH